MSSRVQKGSTVFRPVARPRPSQPSAGSTPSRQTSAVPDSEAVTTPQNFPPGSLTATARNVTKAPPSSTSLLASMPPPSSLPQRAPSVALSTSVPSSSMSATPIAVHTPGVRRPPPIVPSSSADSGSGKILTSRDNVVQSSREGSRPSHVFPSVPPPVPPVVSSEQVPRASDLSAPTSMPPPVQDSSAQLTESYPIDNATAVAALTQLAAALQSTLESHQVAPIENQPEANPIALGMRRRKKRTATSSGKQTTEGESSSGSTNRRRRTPTTTSTTTQRRSRTRQPSVPPFDPTAGPGEELDPTLVTMATLCDDTGQGRVSSKASQIVSNHTAWRAANREKRARMRAHTEARKYGRDVDDEEQPTKQQTEESTDGQPSEASPSGTSEAAEEATGDNEQPSGADSFDYGAHMAKSRYAVQVRIGPNGETIIDEESLFVDREEEADTAGYTHVEESDTTKFVNSATYSRKLRGSRWSAEETELFYDALMQFGENYELISYVLPGRDRRQCKNKFKAEDKKNPARITYCLNNRKPYDIQTLSRLTGKDFSGPTPIITAPARLRLEEEHAEDPTGHDVAAPSAAKKPPSSVAGDEEILGSVDDEQDELPDSLFVK